MGNRFSFDLGTTSVGWAVFDAEGNIITKLIDAGSRVFEEPRDNKTKESNAVARRKARALRRQIRRRVTRRKILIRELKNLNWLEPLAAPPYGFTHNPYKLRTDALDRLLLPSELSEVFFNIAKHRGFKSNRKADRKSAEANQITEAANQIYSKMSELGHRTLGEHLNYLYAKDPLNRLRNRKTLRKMYEDEFNLIIEAQIRMGSTLLNEEISNKLHKIIFYQLPFELQPERRLKTLGICPLEPKERRAYRYDPIAIEFRILKTVNNLKIIDQRTSNERNLTNDEKTTIFFGLLEKSKQTFTGLKRQIGVLDTEIFNLETERSDHIKGDPYYSTIVKTLGKIYKREQKLEIQKTCEILHRVDSIEELIYLCTLEKVSFNKDQLTEIFNSFPIEDDGTTAYSAKAMQKLIPLLRLGHNEYDAIFDIYPPKMDALVYELLPLPTEKITNPTVNRTVHQFRRVYNALVKFYGKPDSVVIELAKEIKQPKWKRDEESKRQKQQEKQREHYAQDIREAKLEPSRDLILRLELAESQNYQCPYTGESFGRADVFAEGRLEIDHILPFSRSLDDSKSNLVLATAESNANKGNKTPGEWLKDDLYHQMIERISKMKFHYFKKKRFYENAKADVDSFISQQLNDTRYASKFIREYVAQSFPPNERLKKVQSLKGSHTAWLRKLWGLNHFLSESAEKNRNDLRHHAVDAIVGGLCTPSTLKKLAEARGGYGKHFNLKLPYETLHSEIKPILERMIVSRMQSKKMSGSFHAETSYSPPKPSEKRGYLRVAHRVGVDKLTLSQAHNIIDRVIKDLVFDRLREKGWMESDDAKAKSLLKEGALLGLKMTSGIPICKVRVEDLMNEKTLRYSKDPHTKNIYRSVVNDGNYSVSLINSLNQKKAPEAIISSIRDSVEGLGAKGSILKLHKTDSVKIKGFGVAYTRKLSATSSNSPYIEFNLHNIAKAEKIAINKDFKRYQSSEKLIEEVTPILVSVLGKV